jgi:peptide deformylase
MTEYGKTFFMSTPVDSPEIGRLELVEYPHPALLRRTRPLVRIDDAIHDAVEQMFDIMYTAGGIGLAANQVGLPYRLFIVNLEARPDAGEELVFINPSLSRPRGNAVQEEGCLSLPGLRMNVRRPEQVVAKAWTLEGEPFEEDLDGLLARVVQHEFDHLEGRLFTDRLPEAAALEARRSLDTFRDVFAGRQSRGELPKSADLLARLDRLEAERCGNA